MPKPTIVILAQPMGQGHKSVAAALKEGLQTYKPDAYNVEVLMLNEVLGDSKLDALLLRVHSRVSRSYPGLYRLLFNLGNSRLLIGLANRLVNRQQKARIIAMFKQYDPVLVVSVFPTWNQTIAKLFKQLYPTRKFVVMVTDLVNTHLSWTTGADIDIILAGNEPTATNLRHQDRHGDRVKVLGYPVKQAYLQPVDPVPQLAALTLPPQAFTQLLLLTTELAEPSNRLIAALEAAYPVDNLIVVTGRNQALHSSLRASRANQTRLLSWVEDMPTLLKSCNLVITKAGGVTVQECLVAQRPLVISRAVAGEEGNAQTVQQNGYGLVAQGGPADVVKAVGAIKDQQADYAQRLAAYPYRHAATDIAAYLHSLIVASN